jgi:hypothetical protein
MPAPGQIGVVETRSSHASEDKITFRNLSKSALDAGCDQFVAKSLTWVAGQKLPDGITPDIAKSLHCDGLVRKSIEKMPRGVPGGKRFWCLEDLNEAAKVYKVPLALRHRTRSAAELEKLADDEIITVAEAARLGMPPNHIELHCDTSTKKRRRKPTPSPILGRLVRGGRLDHYVDAGGYRRRRVGVAIGDVRAYVKALGQPALPDGAILLRDAMPKLKNLGIDRDVTTLVRLIKAGTIEGDKINACTGQRHGKRLGRLWWMKWSDHAKIRRFEKPGNRLCWIDGEDWYPRGDEAWRLAGFTYKGEMPRWVPRKYGGLGKPCPYLTPPRTIRCTYGPIAHRRGDEMVVCAGDDLRDIAEKKTGVRPSVPKKPTGLSILHTNGTGDRMQGKSATATARIPVRPLARTLITHGEAFSMLRISGLTAKEESRSMERIRRTAGDQLYCEKAGNKFLYDHDDWMRVKKTIRSLRPKGSSDDATALKRFTDPSPDEIERLKRQIRAQKKPV